MCILCIDILFRHMPAKFHRLWLKNGYLMVESVQQPSGMKNEKIAHLYPLPQVHSHHFAICLLLVFFGSYNS